AALANSAEPPALTILVSRPPQDLKLSVRFADGSVAQAVELSKDQKAWEAYYRLYYGAINLPEAPSFDGAQLLVDSSENSFVCPLSGYATGRYNSLMTLNMADKTLTMGHSPLRDALLIALRVVLTLVIEGLVLLAFRYRTKRSWLVFLLVNLITQGALNTVLSGPLLSAYWFIAYLFLEAIICVVEMAAFALALKEHTKGRALLYALAANFASLILGGLLLALLPT
ncbi:MAG: hypothetical protein PHO66_05945, partial [Eubacteriales bacterium]|nr:hypothetical protein [Eubacteriales bacterium]